MDPERPRVASTLPALLLVVVAGTLLLGALTPRDLSLGEGAAESASDGDLLAYSFSRLFTAASLLLAASAGTAAVLLRGFPRAGLALWLGFLAYVVSNFVLPAVTGQVPGLDARFLVAPVVFTAVYLARPLSPGRFVLTCKLTLGLFVYGALLAALLAPAKALAEDYQGFLPVLTSRLYGLAGGATSLGAQAAAWLGLELVVPGRSRLRPLHLSAAALALLLTQSKTAWGFTLVLLLLLAWRGAERRLFGADVDALGRLWRWLLRGATALAALGIGALGLALLAGLGSTAADNIQTLTGRTYIWDTTLRIWWERPIFGYGVGLWESQAFRDEHGRFAHAHNQFLQALGSAGLVGLAGLLVYLRVAWRTAARAAPADPVPLLLLALTLVQCFTEAPLRHPYLLDPHTVLHLLLFAALVRATRDGETPAVTAPEADAAAPG